MSEQEWGFFEFDLAYVKCRDGKRITEIGDGCFSTSGYSLEDRFFPLCVRIKNISEEYQSQEKELRKYDFNGLNWPDIHRWLTEHWAATCLREKFKDIDDEKYYYAQRYKELREFVEQFKENYQEMKQKKINGVSLFRN